MGIKRAFSSRMLLTSSDKILWKQITTTQGFPFVRFYPNNIEYNTAYQCYFASKQNCFGYEGNDLCYSTNLTAWKNISGDFLYNPINKHYYEMDITGNGSNGIVTVTEMTGLGLYGNSVQLESVNIGKSTSPTIYVYGVAKLGNYYIIPYVINASYIDGTWRYNCYKKLAYTTNFTTWRVHTFSSQINVDTSNCYSQITPLGSNGSKFVLIDSTANGFCPRVFTSPTASTVYSAIWTGGNMTADEGFMLGGAWYYYSGLYSSYYSTNGTTFTGIRDYWKNPYTYSYQDKYITCNLSTGQLRVYDSNFSEYTDIDTSDRVSAILGVMNNQIYIITGSRTMYCTDITNLIN